jgi:hypothetical protein
VTIGRIVSGLCADCGMIVTFSADISRLLTGSDVGSNYDYNRVPICTKVITVILAIIVIVYS